MPFFSGKRTFPWIDALILLLISGFVLVFLFSSGLLLNTTPTGGDMASHVFTAWYFKYKLLAHGELSGWCMGNLGGFPMLQNYFFLPFLLMVGLSFLLPLSVAIKLVAVSGILSLPWVTWFFLRKLRQPHPVAIAGAMTSLIFLFNEGQSIWGGNILSTLSGTFCYGLGFSMALIFLGCLYAHFHTRPQPVLCAVCLALTGFCHGYTLLFAGFGSLFFLWLPGRFVRHMRSLILINGLAVGLMAFWLFPLLAYTPYTTKFGFEWLFPDVHQTLSQVFPVLIRPCVLLALAGFVFVVRNRLTRRFESHDRPFFFVMYLALTGLCLYSAGARINLVDVRFLPFFQFFLMITGAFIFSRFPWGKPSSALAMVFILFCCLTWVNSRETLVRPWLFHNFKGWENTRLWQDYSSVTQRVSGTEQDPRLAYEHSPVLEAAGSIRAFESLPFFSGRSTLEGLYIQASILSPFIYYIQSELSEHPSMPLEDYVYSDVNLERALDHLKLFNVNQVILTETSTQKQALSHPSYRLSHRAGPFMVFDLPSPMNTYVEPLAFTPALISHGSFRRHFFTWFRQGDLSVPLIYDNTPGPNERQRMVQVHPEDISRIHTPSLPPGRGQPEVRLSRDTITIDGATPHLPLMVKVSYHPNWKAEGADKVYLAAPGFMVVYPETSHIQLHYSPSFPEHLGRLISVLALVFALVYTMIAFWRKNLGPQGP